MNYRLPQDRFIEIKERGGVIENNSNGYIEIAIINEDAQPVIDATTNKKVEENGKIFYQAEANQKIFARSISYIVADINVSEMIKSEIDCDFDPNSYYTKSKTDELFVKKEGNKVLSDNNFTNELKGKLENIKAKDVSFDDGETFQQKLNENKLNGKSAYELAKEKGYTGSEEQYMYSLKGDSATQPLTVSIEKTSDAIAYKYTGEQDIEVAYIKDVILKTISDEIIALKNLKISNLPKEATHLRCDLVSFFGVDSRGVMTGTINPTRKVGNTDLHPYLKNLDPTKDIKFDVEMSRCSIVMNYNYDELVSTPLAQLKSSIPNTEKIASMQIELSVLNNDVVMTKLKVRHYFKKTIENNELRTIITLADLQPKTFSTQSTGREFKLHYCSEMEYQGIEKIRDDSTIYMVLNEETGDIKLKVYRP